MVILKKTNQNLQIEPAYNIMMLYINEGINTYIIKGKKDKYFVPAL